MEDHYKDLTKSEEIRKKEDKEHIAQKKKEKAEMAKKEKVWVYFRLSYSPLRPSFHSICFSIFLLFPHIWVVVCCIVCIINIFL